MVIDSSASIYWTGFHDDCGELVYAAARSGVDTMRVVVGVGIDVSLSSFVGAASTRAQQGLQYTSQVAAILRQNKCFK